MRFFRRDRTTGWLALFALATQLVLSFGHVHHHAEQYTQAAAAESCAANAASHCPAHHDEDDERFCSICWTISITGALVLPAPVVVEIPSLAPVTPEPPALVATFSDNKTVQFQARAPPLVEAAT